MRKRMLVGSLYLVLSALALTACFSPVVNPASERATSPAGGRQYPTAQPTMMPSPTPVPAPRPEPTHPAPTPVGEAGQTENADCSSQPAPGAYLPADSLTESSLKAVRAGLASAM